MDFSFKFIYNFTSDMKIKFLFIMLVFQLHLITYQFPINNNR